MEKIEIKPIFITEEDKKFLDEFTKSQRIFQHYISNLFRLPEELITGKNNFTEKKEKLAKNRFELMDI